MVNHLNIVTYVIFYALISEYMSVPLNRIFKLMKNTILMINVEKKLKNNFLNESALSKLILQKEKKIRTLFYV